jgi:hypothetical protein
LGGGGLNFHIIMFTYRKIDRFQKKSVRQDTSIWIFATPRIIAPSYGPAENGHCIISWRINICNGHTFRTNRFGQNQLICQSSKCIKIFTKSFWRLCKAGFRVQFFPWSDLFPFVGITYYSLLRQLDVAKWMLTKEKDRFARKNPL